MRAAASDLVITREALADFARGPLALAMSVVLLLIIAAFGNLGQWRLSQTLALSIGMTASMLVAGSFVQAMGRRGSICLALEDRAAAWRFLWMVFVAAAVCAGLVAGLAVLAMARLDLLLPAERLTFVLAFLGLSAIWLAAGWLSIVNAPAWLAGGLAAGLLAGAATDRVVAPYSDLHLTVGSGVGFVVAMALVMYRVRRALAPGRAAKKEPVVLPPAAFLAYEAAPYFAYGLLYMLLVLLVHAFGWAGARPGTAGWLGPVATLELGLTASLAPLVLSGGIAEHVVRLFWKRALAAQQMTSGAEPHRFSRVLLDYHGRWLAVYALGLASLSVGYYLLVEPLIGSPLLTQLLGDMDAWSLRIVFAGALVGYWLLGIGQLNSSFAISLALPGRATRQVLWGLAATVAAGVPSVLLLGYICVAPTIVIGAAVYAASALASVRRVLHTADYHYTASF